jgi:hypothetical protein
VFVVTRFSAAVTRTPERRMSAASFCATTWSGKSAEPGGVPGFAEAGVESERQANGAEVFGKVAARATFFWPSSAARPQPLR